MQDFLLDRPRDLGTALQPGGRYIAGGTDLMQLMRDNVEAPPRLIDLERLDLAAITTDDAGVRLGALATMAAVAAHPAVKQNWPALSEALLLSASPQVRNMGTVGGNLLQRTRCGYFRDTGFACNKRAPGSGCPAIAGDSRHLAIFGGSVDCIATHPSDMPVALLALDASVELLAPGGARRSEKLADFYRLPGDAPHIETVLLPGEMILGVQVPHSAAARRSRYVKVRDRTSFAFALAAAAVALEIEGGTIREARIAAGGVGPMPWGLPAVEAALRGAPATEASFRAAAAKAGEGATPTPQNAFKVELLRRTVQRALLTAAG